MDYNEVRRTLKYIRQNTTDAQHKEALKIAMDCVVKQQRLERYVNRGEVENDKGIKKTR